MGRDMFIKILLDRRVIAIFSVLCLILFIFYVPQFKTWAGETKTKGTQTQGLEAQRRVIEKTNAQLESKKRQINSEIRSLNIELETLRAKKEKLSPPHMPDMLQAALPMLLKWIGGLLLISLSSFLPAMLLLLFLFIIFVKRDFFKKRMIVVVVIFAVLFILSVLPVFAATKNEGYSNPPSIDQKLEKVGKLCTLGTIDKTIFLLENKQPSEIEIPVITMPKPYGYLKPQKKVKVESFGYHYTLGCLYLLKDQGGKAKEQFEWVYTHVPQSWYSPDKRYEYMLVSIVRYFIENGDPTSAGKALDSALPAIFSVKELLSLHDYLDKHGMSPSAQKCIERAQQAAKTTEDKMNLVNFLLEKGKTEDANNLLNSTINSTRNTDTLINAALFCIERKLYPTAISALNRIFIYSPQAIDKVISFPSMLPPSIPRPPTTQEITLPVLLGIVYQLHNELDSAEYVYKMAANVDLSQIEKTACTNITCNPNNIFYLKQLWQKEGEKEKLKKLDPIYLLVKKHFIQHYIEAVRTRNQQLAKTYNKLTSKKKEFKWEIYKSKLSIFLRELRLLVLLIVLLGMVIYCSYDAWQYTHINDAFKSFAFLGKFNEDWGWCLCFTIISMPIGIFLIILGQGMLIFLKTQQGIESLHKIGPTESVHSQTIDA